MDPHYPLYIVSKGRANIQATSCALHRMRVKHYVVVEADQRSDYESQANESATFLTLDPTFQQTYDTCDELGDTKSKGPGAARNFAWEHSIAGGYEWHWVMDDNIFGFYRLNQNLKSPVDTGTFFRCMEDFAERYENVGMVGPNYIFFAKRKQLLPPFITNTRIYSCNFIRNDLPLRWRGRYNEDTDLSLRVLKMGLCTVQFNAFLQNKANTQTISGGCTTEFYAKEGTMPKSEMQVKLHKDVSRIVWKFGRWHHHVDYNRFKQKLRRRQDVVVKQGVDNFGMVLKYIE